MKNKLPLKILSFILLLCIILPQLPLKRVEAQVLGTGVTPTVRVATTDPFSLKKFVEDTWKATIMSKTFWMRIYDKAKKMAFEILRQAILDRLVQNLIKWIEGGGRGAIVDNWDAFFQDAANRAGGVFASQIGNGFLCGPFNLQVQLSLLPVQQFDSVTCTLNDVVSNIDNFMEDFRNGSWLGYQSSWEPRNNFYGATLMAIDAKSRAEQQAVTAAASEAAAGKGFLSFKKCKFIKDPNGTLDVAGRPVGPKDLEAMRMSGGAYKKDCVITTPGEVAAQATTQALVNVPFMKAGSATSDLISGYLAAIVNASVNTLTKAAVDGLKGVVAESLKDTKINPVLPCAGLTGEAFRSCMTSVNAERSEYNFSQDSTQSVFADANGMDIRFQIAGYYSQSIFNERNLIDSLSNLAACRNNPPDLVQQINDEQEIIDLIQLKFDDNQTIIDQIQNDQTGTSDPDLEFTSTNQSDWASLTRLSNIETNFDSLVEELNSSKDELAIIKAKVESQLPNIELQLQSCPQLVPAPPSNL